MPQGQVPPRILLIWPKRQGVAWTADALMLAAKRILRCLPRFHLERRCALNLQIIGEQNKHHVLGVLRVFLVRRCNATLQL